MEIFKNIFCLIFVAIGIVAFIYYYKKTHDILNPFGIVLGIWYIVAGIANLNLSKIETQWNIIMYFVVALFPLMIIIVASVGKITTLSREKFKRVELSNCYIIFSRIVFAICVICAFVEFKQQGFVVAFMADLEGTADAKSLVQYVSVWHYGTSFLPYCSICAFYELLFKKIKNRFDIIFLLAEVILPILHSLFITISRGSLLIIVLGMVYILSRKIDIRPSMFFSVTIAIIIVFVLIMQIRVNQASFVYNVIHGHPVISSIYAYTALNFNNLNLLIKNGSSWLIVNRTFGGITQLLGLYSFFNIPSTYMTRFFNAMPICYAFYDDLGILGVALYTCIIYGIVKILYNKSNSNQNYMILFAALQKAIWMSIFGNYFSQYRVILFPYIVLAIMVKLMNVRFKPISNRKLK